MDVEYKKDLRYNYMVIAISEDQSIEPYCIKMLEHQIIEGVLLLEQRRIDNRILFYYEITGKQSMVNLFDKTILSFDKMKLLFLRLLHTMERAYEFLLCVDDFVLSPDYIYLDVTTNQPYLCMYSGYRKNIKEQMNGLIEYLMNKVDYNDKDAVLLVYQLYAVTREEGFSFDHLLEVLQKPTQPSLDMMSNKKGIAGDEKSITLLQPIAAEKQESRDLGMSVMMEKLEGEEEVPCYPFRTYLYTAASILGCIIVTVLGFTSKILYNTFGNRIDYSKLFAMFLIILCVEGYLLKIIWDKVNKITKLVIKKEYIDPRLEQDRQGTIYPRKSLNVVKLENVQTNRQDNTIKKINRDFSIEQEQQKKNMEVIRMDSSPVEDMPEEEDDNPTCLLNEKDEKATLVLKSLEEANYKNILITDFPFFIGKLKKNVDYCLEKDVVSRFHAKITKEEEQYYITDLNSTNGTFVNQEGLQTYQKKEIKIGDEIAFANIKYLFSI